MLQSIRNIAHSWIVKALMLFLIVSFSIWGIGDIFRGNSLRRAVASVGNLDITVQDANRLFERTLAEARQKFDPNLTADQAKKMGLLETAVEGEIRRQLIDMDVRRQGIRVGADAVLKLLGDEPQLRNKDGSFNRQLFQQILQQQRISEAAFIANEQQALAREILTSAIGGNVVVPQTEVDQVYAALAQKRLLEVVTVDASKMTGIPAPTAEQIKAFYDANQGLFTAPEYRSFTVASLAAESLVKDISITDEDLKKEYESKLSELGKPERRDIVQVVMQDEAKAKELAGKARASGDIGDAAKAFKQTAIPLDKMEQKNLMPELAKEVFAMREGQVSDPIKTQLGWHVLQVKRIAAAVTPSFDKIKDKLRAEMIHDQAVEAATRVVNQLDDQLAAGHSLDDIADGLRLRLTKVAAVDATGAQADGKATSDIPNKDEALKLAFAQNAGETSPVEDNKAGVYYVVRTDDIVPSGVRPLDEVKAKVATAWTKHEQDLKAQAKAQKILEALKAGAAFDAYDRDEGVSSRLSEPLSLLGDTDKALPLAVMQKAFRLLKDAPELVAADGKQMIVRVAKVVSVNPSASDPRKSMIRAELKRARGNELFEQYIGHLYTVFPVKKNMEALNTLRQHEE